MPKRRKNDEYPMKTKTWSEFRSKYYSKLKYKGSEQEKRGGKFKIISPTSFPIMVISE